VIRSFRDPEAGKIFQGEHSKAYANIERVARRKLIEIDSAKVLQDLGVLPGNHLEALPGDRKGQHSLRINRQYRICFTWREPDAYDVEITDYH
jgi:proteic killer suppression protein